MGQPPSDAKLTELERMIREANIETRKIQDQVSYEDGEFMRGYAQGLTTAWRLFMGEE